MDPFRRQFLKSVASTALCAAVPTAARSQAQFPSRSIRCVVGLPAGGAADIIIRLIGQELQKSLGQSVWIDNKPGGLYQIAVQAVQSAPADGHTVMYVNSSFVAVQAVQKQFDLQKDFQLVAKTGESIGVIAVNPNSPHKTIKDLLDAARAKPESLKYGILGAGSWEHLFMLSFERAAGFRGLAIPYKGGPDMLNGVVQGDLDFTLINVVNALQFQASGKIRILATRATERLPALPDVPTLEEAGVKLPLKTFWSGFMVRTGTPPAVVEQLRNALMSAMSTPTVFERIQSMGLVYKVDPAETIDVINKYIADELAMLTDLAKLVDVPKQ